MYDQKENASDYYSYLMPSCMRDAARTGHVNADSGY